MVDGFGVDSDTVWAILDVFTDADEMLATQIALQQEILSELKSDSDDDNSGTIIGAGSVVDSASVTDIPVSPTAFEQRQTDEDITLGPGEKDDIVSVNLDGAALWYEVGDSDNDYSEYQYYADESGILDNPQVEPLGLYNDPYRFPQPLLVRDTIKVSTKRQPDAPGSADYFSKVRYIPIRNETADTLEKVWRSV